MKVFLSCLFDRIAYEYTSKRKEFLIYADSEQEAVQKLNRYKRMIPWFDADYLARNLELREFVIDELDEGKILRGDLRAYIANEFVNGEYQPGFILFGRSAAEIRRRLSSFEGMVISALPKIEDIIL
jgi:hypothetical protein|nr:MAG TPA: hypothetical protein [Caudoviricetes sp.]